MTPFPSGSVEHLGCHLSHCVSGANGEPVVLILVPSAAQDRIAPPSAGRALAAAIPGARYAEIPDASHGVTIARPALVNALLLDHFDRATRPAAALAAVPSGNVLAR